MRKSYVTGLTLLVGFVFGATMVSTASAELVWLVGNARAAEKVPAVMEGTVKVDILNALLGLVLEYECSVEFDGTVGPGAEDEITKVLDLVLKDIPSLSTLGTGLDCTVIGTSIICTNAAKLVEIWPDNLPWPTLLEAMAAGEEEFLDIIGLVNGNEKDPGLDFECENSNGSFTEGLCEGQLTLVLLNTVENDVLGLLLEQDQQCTEAGTTLHLTGEFLIFTTSGLPLAVSNV
jgi:hypothetical protein